MTAIAPAELVRACGPWNVRIRGFSITFRHQRSALASTNAAASPPMTVTMTGAGILREGDHA
jgi:hypothetical protein